MLYLAGIYTHTRLIQIFFWHALIKHKDSFSSALSTVLSAGSFQTAGTEPFRHPPSPDTHSQWPPLPKTCYRGRLVQAKAGRLRNVGSGAGGQAHPSPMNKQMGQGVMGPSRPSKSTLLPGPLQSQQSLFNKHPQKTSLKTKQVCSCTPQIVGSPSGAVMSCRSWAWFLRFARRAEGEEVGGRACWQPCASHLLPWRFAGGQF